MYGLQKQTKSLYDINSNIDDLKSKVDTRMSEINNSINRNTKMIEINNATAKSINNYAGYLAFAAKQQRLANGHLT